MRDISTVQRRRCRFLDDTEAIELQFPNNRRLPRAGGSRQDKSLHVPVISLTVDAAPSFIYKPPMICAFPCPMATTESRSYAVGSEGMRVR